MGANCSSLSEINSNEYLLKLCGPAPLSVNDPVWNQLFSFGVQIPISRSEHEYVIEKTSGLFKLLRNNSETQNAASLMKQFLVRATELKASAQCDDKIFIWQTCNGLFILQIILAHLIQNEREAALVKKFTIKCEDAFDSLLENCVVQLVEILIDVPLNEETALLHVQSVQTLILLLYAAASSYLLNSKSILFRCLMTGRGALHAGLLTRTLLQHYYQQNPVPVSWLRKPEQSGSIVVGLATGLWSLISRNSSTTEVETNKISDFSLQSLLLLLILTNHCCGDNNWSNPYRQALLSFTDSKDPVQVSVVHPGACFRLDYSVIYSTICDRLKDERTTLLLYLLLHQHQQFRNYVYTHADLQRMVLALLHVLYEGDNQGSHHLYMSLIILLLLSEDEGFNSNIHNIVVRNPQWYTERLLNEISLGGLIVLVVVRTIQRNVINASDKYLHTNCLATLANMAAHFRRLHSYVCQRLFSLLCVLNKRRMRIVELLKSCCVSIDGDPKSNYEQDLSVVDEVLRMFLEILNAAFSHQLSSNQHLIYSMLHQKEVLDILRRQASFQDVVANLDTVSNYFSSKISHLVEPGVGDILQTIRLSCTDFPSDQLKKFPELKFRYVEEDEPEEFFIPYVWSMVQSSSILYWRSDALVNLENGNLC